MLRYLYIFLGRNCKLMKKMNMIVEESAGDELETMLSQVSAVAPSRRPSLTQCRLLLICCLLLLHICKLFGMLTV